MIPLQSFNSNTLLQTMNTTDEGATSKSTQLSTKVWVKLLLLLENALKINFKAL